jgi:hypothetical protein
MSFFNSKTEISQKERAIAYKQVFSGENGDMVIRDLINRFHVLNSHSGGAKEEGQRSVVLYLLEQRYVDADKFLRILTGEMI